MKVVIALITLFLFASIPTGLFAQTVEERLNALEKVLKEQEKTIKEQQKVIEDLLAEVKELQPPPPVQGVAAAKEPVETANKPVEAAKEPAETQQVQEQVQELKEKVDQVAEAQTRTVPSVFNPAVGLVGETVFSYRSKGSDETGSDRPGGFDAFQRSVELNLSASVDPFAKGYAVINASADPKTGEANATVEEAAIQTTSLPWNLEVKAGRFFGEFGRLSYIHDHELPFVNRPLALEEYVGGESRTDGVQVNYLVPIPHYVSLTVGAGNQFGGDVPPNDVGTFRQGSNVNYWGRLSSFFDITPDISFEPGISGLWNPATTDLGGGLPQPDGSTFFERERRLAGADFMLSYKPLRNNQFQTVTWGTEVLYSDNRYNVDEPAGAILNRAVGSTGLYSYLAYKFDRQWTVGFLYDFVESPENNRAKTSAYSPYITWALSHWDQLRLQYTYTNPNVATGFKPDNAVYLQWAWIIGAHSHGWQER